MKKITKALNDIGTLDELARQNTGIHRIDPRAKIITTAGFLLCVVSFGRYEFIGLVPLFLYPVSLLILGHIPFFLLFRYLLLACPFALMIGITNPFFDTLPIGPFTGGWVSLWVICIKFLLTVSTGLALIAVTGMNSLCSALERLGVPCLLVMQIQFVYRYLFLLAHEAGRMSLAHAMRSNGTSLQWRHWTTLAGNLLLRSYDRASRIHRAMNCRGFLGEFRTLLDLHFTRTDYLFVIGWLIYFVVVRYGDLPHRLGTLLIGRFL